MIHLAHDFTDATVLIFGGGRVGARRAVTFDEAEVVVVSPAFAGADFGGAALVRAEPDPEHARALIGRAEPALVVAATDDEELNAAVATAGREVGALVNRADSQASGAGAVDVPATATDGPVVASVSTGGRSPTLSGYLRERIGDELDGSGAVAEAVGELRAELRERGLALDPRREALRAVVESDRVWRAARADGDVRAVADQVVEAALAETDPADGAED